MSNLKLKETGLVGDVTIIKEVVYTFEGSPDYTILEYLPVMVRDMTIGGDE